MSSLRKAEEAEREPERLLRKGRRYGGSEEGKKVSRVQKRNWRQHFVPLFLTTVTGKTRGVAMVGAGRALQGDCAVSSEALPSNGARVELAKGLWPCTASL